MKWQSNRTAAVAVNPFTLFCLLLFTAFSGLVTLAHADTIVHGFKTKSTLLPGFIVTLSQSSSDTVETVPGNDPSRIYGVVIDPSQAPVTVQQEGQQVFVATGGNYPVLVNTENGPIKPGDYISTSAVEGIGAKASQNQPLVLGQAIEGFDGKKGVIANDSSQGALGRITVSIIPGKNPLVKDSVAIPSPLKRFGEAVAGKNVSAVRIYAALAFFIVTAAIAFALLWSGVRNGMISIGRNPLSKKSIMRGLLQVIIMAFGVFIVGMIGVYLLLKL
jgi:hypothetical protein